MIKVSAIIVTYNGKQWIEQCISSLQRSALAIEIVVIDNASTDNTATIIKERFPSVHFIQTGSNLGFGKANNIGVRYALQQNADYVFLLNQDAWIEPKCINTLVTVHQSNPAFGILSPMHMSGDDTALEFKFIEYIQPNACPGLISDHFMNTLKSIYETTFVNAAAWLISKDCLQTVGGFDPLFPHYGEDVDYTLRAQYYKYKVGICPHTKIWHDSRLLSWNEILHNRKRMLTIYMSDLKSISGSLRSNTLVFIKRRFDELTSHLLFRRFNVFAYQFGLVWSSLLQLNKISKARKASKVKGAFLEAA